MNYSYLKTENEVFEFDELVLNPNISPEVSFLSTNSKEYLSYQVAIMQLASFVNMTVRWIYTIENENQTKVLLKCSIEDVFNLTDLKSKDNCDEKLTTMVDESVIRLSDYFDFNKPQTGLLLHTCLYPSQPEIDHFVTYVKEELKKRGL